MRWPAVKGVGLNSKEVISKERFRLIMMMFKSGTRVRTESFKYASYDLAAEAFEFAVRSVRFRHSELAEQNESKEAESGTPGAKRQGKRQLPE